jgi:hypothetical protein
MEVWLRALHARARHYFRSVNEGQRETLDSARGRAGVAVGAGEGECERARAQQKKHERTDSSKIFTKRPAAPE